jgi:hypothetical protein
VEDILAVYISIILALPCYFLCILNALLRYECIGILTLIRGVHASLNVQIIPRNVEDRLTQLEGKEAIGIKIFVP